MREHECLGQIEAAHDWPNGKEQHHQLELLQDHKVETLLTGTQCAERTEYIMHSLNSITTENIYKIKRK